MNKDALLAVVAEFNEKRMANIESPDVLDELDLWDVIMAVTNHGESLGRLSKAAKATISAGFAVYGDADSVDGDVPLESDGPIEESAEDGGSPEELSTSPDLAEHPDNDFTSREALNMAAEDMNEVMELNPQIRIEWEDKMFLQAFKKAAAVAEGTDNFSEHTWNVFAAMRVGPKRIRMAPVIMVTDEKPVGKQKESKEPKLAKEPKAPRESRPPRNAGKQGVVRQSREGQSPGVFAYIQEFLRKQLPQTQFSRKDVLDYLVEKLPDNNADSMATTLKVAIPYRLQAKGYEFIKVSPGIYSVLKCPE